MKELFLWLQNKWKAFQPIKDEFCIKWKVKIENFLMSLPSIIWGYIKKYFKHLVLLILIVFSVFFVYRAVSNLLAENRRLHTELIGQQEKYEQLNKYTAKLEVQYKTEEELS